MGIVWKCPFNPSQTVASLKSVFAPWHFLANFTQLITTVNLHLTTCFLSASNVTYVHMDDILQVEYGFYLCHLIILMPIGRMTVLAFACYACC